MLASSLVFASFVAEAQPAAKVYRVGYLSTGASVEPFRQALRELGYVEGQNLAMEVRLAAGRLDQLPALAAELVRANVDLIVAASPPAIQAAKDATAKIPIVMAFTSIDPIQSGFVASFSRPGGNITGVAMIADEIVGKRLAVLKAIVPRATRIALLAQVNHSASAGQIKAAREQARSLGIELDLVEVRDSRDYEHAFAAVASRASGLLVLANPTFFDDRSLLASLALRHRVPMLCEWRGMAEVGCLAAYGPKGDDLIRRAAVYVDRIARGARPSELPVEQPTRFELVVNMKTAEALGIAVLPSMLVNADEVIR